MAERNLIRKELSAVVLVVLIEEQRNKLAHCLFQEIWIKDKEVVAVKSQPELKPFFQLSYEEYLKSSKWQPRGSDYPLILYIEIFPVLAPLYLAVPPRSNRKLDPAVWSELAEQYETKSFRSLAREYKVSHEAVRRALKAKRAAASYVTSLAAESPR